MLYKGTAFDTQEINKGKRIAVIKFATYGSLDRDGDMSNKGMFTKSWQEAPEDVRFFLNHNKGLAPGRLQAFDDGRPALWDDEKGAYARLYLGTHTLGDDTLKQMDEGIITNNSFGFDPIKAPPIKDKGKNFKEVKHWEVSVLTHWGAHPDSTVMEVNKALNKDYMGSFSVGDEVEVRPDMEHVEAHAGQTMFITEKTGWDYSAFYSVRLEDGTNYRWYRGDELVPADDALQDNDGDDDEKARDLDLQIKSLEKFCRNTTASDTTIKELQSELEDLKSARELLNNTAVTSPRRKPDASVSNEFADALTLLTLKF